MTKVIVEFEVNIKHVGKGYFEKILKSEMEMSDMQGSQQVKVTKIIAPPNWK